MIGIKGGSRIFSGGGGCGGFSKKNLKFCRPFFLVDQTDFSSSPKGLFCPYFSQIFLKGVSRHLLENFDQKNCVFSARAPPSKLV